MFDFYTRQLEACDAEIERRYGSVRPKENGSEDDDLSPVPEHKRKSHSKTCTESAVKVKSEKRPTIAP